MALPHLPLFNLRRDWSQLVTPSDTHDQTYKIRRFHRDDSHPDHRKVIREGLTLDEAQEHCQREDTREEDSQGTVWFDGYDRES